MNFAKTTLEFDLILSEISNNSYTNTVRNKILNLNPLTDLVEITNRQNKINESINIISRSGGLPFLKNFDILDVLSLIKLKRDLTIADLQDLRLFLRMAEDIKRKAEKFKDEQVQTSYLNVYFEYINAHEDVIDAIDSVLSPDASILDSASEELYKIRKEISKVEKRREKILRDMLVSKARLLNENILIMRNDRYCLPVKTDLKNQIKGIVHDVSASKTTTYIEPLEASELSNQIVKLNKDEEAEILNILRNLSAYIHPLYEQLNITMEVLLDLDFYFACGTYSLKYNCHMPNMNSLGNVNLINARHPLINQSEVVPVNIKINEFKPILMITGPNTGGKTVALKTLGLLTMMAQTGLLIPASSESDVSIFSGIYADIGDHQSIKQSLSTFSSHIKNVNEIINKAGDLSLILLDELGSGTDPNEGTSLAMSILDYFLSKNVRLVLTTHYSELKIYAYESPVIQNASVKFDEETLKPLYEIDYGKSGSSNAIKIAKRLGMNEEITSNALKYLNEKKTDLSASVERFEEKIELLNKRLESIKDTENIIKEKERLVNEKILALEIEKEKLFLNAEKEVKKQVKKITEEASLILKRLEEQPKEHEVAELKGELAKLGIKRENKDKPSDLKVGNFVYIKPYNQYGEIISKKKNLYVVQFGIFELEFKGSELVRSEEFKQESKKVKKGDTKTPSSKYATSELDLRGYRYEDVKEAYKKFIDQALLANLKELRIIHGFGTGAVRKALYEELKKDKNVKSYRYGGEYEGMAGVTIVTIA